MERAKAIVITGHVVRGLFGKGRVMMSGHVCLHLHLPLRAMERAKAIVITGHVVRGLFGKGRVMMSGHVCLHLHLPLRAMERAKAIGCAYVRRCNMIGCVR